MAIYEPAKEQMPRELLEQLQVERLQTTLNRVYRNVAFYRQSFDERGIDVRDVKEIASLRQLPFTTKEDLRASYPYDMFAVPLRDIVRIHSTSGTTGKPIGVGYTQNDLDHWATLIARVLTGCGIDERDFVQIAFHNLATGTFGFHAGAERLKASVIPASIPDLHEQLRMMRDYRTTALVCTPTYALRIALALEDSEISPHELNLAVGLFGGEPWSDDLRAELEERLHIKAYDNFGLSEIMGPGVSGECEVREGLHINEDHFLVEVIDPITTEPMPPGKAGELVFTTLTKEGFPLIRYRTGDLAALLPGACACGRTFARMSRVSGRCDDLVICGETKFFPARVEEILLQAEGVEPHGELYVQREGATDSMELHVELDPAVPRLDEIKTLERIKRQLAEGIERAIGISPRVVFVEHGTLVRSAGKRNVVVHDKRTR